MSKLEDSFPLVIIRQAIIVRHEGEDYVAAWADCYNDDKDIHKNSPPSLLVAMTLEGDDLEGSDLEREVKNLARKFRVEQIRKELGIDSDIEDLPTIQKLLDRVWAGEWVGQFNFSGTLYFEELGSLLHPEDPWRNIWETVDGIVSNRLADVLPGSWILTEPQGDKPLRGSQIFGHEEFVGSDSGEVWTCHACGKTDREDIDPNAVPCL